MSKLLFPVYEFRPIFDGQLMRYNNGDWKEDDGEYDIAFYTIRDVFSFGVDLPYYKNIRWSWCKNMAWGGYVSGHPGGNAWHYSTKDGTQNFGDSWRERDTHPNIKARDLASTELCNKEGCANGTGPRLFHYDCQYILNGLVRERETKKILTVPKIMDCVYCGKHKPFDECSHIKRILSGDLKVV
jgi:hypothetical protein